ncbi:MAG: hypothetical protein KBA95_05900 [Acidobacteria bacterium]|nr:hypothetical protein [Acidobacteriota bacterium]
MPEIYEAVRRVGADSPAVLIDFLGTHDCMVDFREFRRAARDRPGTAQGRAAGPS